MFLNTTLYLVGHETVKRQGNKLMAEIDNQ